MIKIKISYLSVLLLLTLVPGAQTKQPGIQKFLDTPELKHASVGICVKDFSGRTIASHNAGKSYTPASILKVVTTATALEVFGEGYTYRTTLARDKNQGNRLLVHGYGDPTLGTEFLDNTPDTFLSQWVAAINEKFDTTEDIDITVIDDYFGYDGISHRWIYQDIGNYYASGAYGISIYDNTYRLYFNTMRRDTCPVILKTEPEVKLFFQNTLTLNNTGQDNGYIHGEPFSTIRLLTGDIPAGKPSFSIRGDIPNPGIYLGEVLANQLMDKGFSISSVETTYDKYNTEMHRKDRTPFSEDVFYTHHSFPLRDIIKDVNVRSNNHYAEHLLRTIGRAKDADIYTSALDKGVEKTKELWKARGLDTDALMMFDGSGLSPSNAVSPGFMCDLLVYMKTKSGNKNVFFESFPGAGKDGTVSYRLRGTRLAGKIFMKSGSIYGVQCFSGYYIDGEKKYAFTVMVNKFTGARGAVSKAIDNLLLSLF